MDAEIDLFLGAADQGDNKRHGYVSRTYGIKGAGQVRLRVPRDRKGRFESDVVPAHRRCDVATERALAPLHLAGISTRMLAHVSRSVLGVAVSAQELSASIERVVPAAIVGSGDAVADGLDAHALGDTIKRLAARWFVLRDAHAGAPVLLNVRTAMSWLRGSSGF